jgi:hypothetical protein
MSKVLEVFNNGKKFLVSYVVADLHWQELARVVHNRVEYPLSPHESYDLLHCM